MLTALSPLDGRYHSKVQELGPYFSESALIRYRILVEVEWVIHLCNSVKLTGTRLLKVYEIKTLQDLYQKFSEKDGARVKEIEKITNHDVKAVEYFIREKIGKTPLLTLSELIHLGCTSDDTNNLAYTLMLKESLKNVLLPVLNELVKEIKNQARKYARVVMLGYTHGQPASPTTMGKELLVFVSRFEHQIQILTQIPFLGKWNGAVGNYNAHLIAYPQVDWLKANEQFVKKLGLTPNLLTTQIEPHDFLAEIFDCFRRINTILIDFDRDIWLYISFHYFKQKIKEGEVGSSTMPHKVNPIDFENSEGNLGVATALLSNFSEKLPISRLQRDLSDSTVFRNIGSALGYSLLAWKSTLKGLSKLEINSEIIEKDLEENWVVLSEAVQTVLRKNKVEGAYEKLKELTRGKKLTKENYRNFVQKLKIPGEDKKRLLALKPQTYFGLAPKLISRYLK